MEIPIWVLLPFIFIPALVWRYRQWKTYQKQKTHLRQKTLDAFSK